jgi:hypothetical protein
LRIDLQSRLPLASSCALNYLGHHMTSRFDITDPSSAIGPYGVVGSIFHVVMCGLLIVVGVVLEIVFVRIMIRARRQARADALKREREVRREG